MYQNASLFHELVAKHRSAQCKPSNNVVDIRTKKTPDAFALQKNGGVLSIQNNDFHPSLNARSCHDFDLFRSFLSDAIPSLSAAGKIMLQYDLRMNEFFTAVNLLNSYIYILDETLEKPQNERVANYAKSAKVGQK